MAQRRLAASELTLKRLSNNGKISGSKRIKRQKFLLSQKQRLEKLETIFKNEKTLTTQPEKMGFPQISQLSQRETQIIHSSCDMQFKMWHSLYQNLKSIFSWCEQAEIKEQKIIGIFKLAKLKRVLGSLDSEKAKLDYEVDRQNRSLTALAKAFPRPELQNLPQLDQIRTIYESESKFIDHLQKLEKKISSKQQEISYMQNWLLETRQTIRRKVPNQTPSHGDLANARRRIQGFRTGRIFTAKRLIEQGAIDLDSYINRFAGWDDISYHAEMSDEL
ncbi:MAG: hypothetical protein HRU19_25435 [Pseudobacteriovorax sp.]|nr:hypothetical protein [Pseudobacteriovorax sp.]